MSSTHKAATNIFWNDKLKKFQCGNKCLSGLCPTLHTLFYPDFDFQSAFNRYNGKTSVQVDVSTTKKTIKRFIPVWIYKKRLAATTVVAPSDTPMSSSSSSSSTPTRVQAGVILDTEVTELVGLVKNKISLKQIIGACSATTAFSTESFWVRSRVARWSAPTKALAVLLDAKGYLPERSQLVVGSLQCGVATKIDLLCLDLIHHVYVVIECKVGYDYGDCGSDVKMSAPFEAFDARVSNQIQLQLLGSMILLEKHFGLKPDNVHGIVLRWKSSTDSFEETPIDPALRKLSASLWQALVARQ